MQSNQTSTITINIWVSTDQPVTVIGTISCPTTASGSRPTTTIVNLSFAPRWNVAMPIEQYSETGVTHSVANGARPGSK